MATRIGRLYRLQPHLHSKPCIAANLMHQRYFGLFGPTEHDWKRWAKEFEFQDREEEENKKRDPREVTPQELRESKYLQNQFLVDFSVIPTLELPRTAWYSDSHVYIQQTNLDDVWRLGYTPLRFVGTRHVEWLIFDSEPHDIKLYSEAIMYFSINDYKPIKLIGQSINDIQFTLTSPFHRVKVISVNEKISSEPSLIIDDDLDINWKWLITFKWINKREQIFSKPPINNGRYGRWFDEEQYVEWAKDQGLYKKWQIDQVTKMAENKALQRMKKHEKTPKEMRDERVMKEKMQDIDTRPRYLKVDDEMKGIHPEDGGSGRSWKPKWFPF